MELLAVVLLGKIFLMNRFATVWGCSPSDIRRVFDAERCLLFSDIKWYSDWAKTLAASSSWSWNYFHFNLTASAFSQRKCKWSGELIHDRSCWPAVVGTIRTRDTGVCPGHYEALLEPRSQTDLRFHERSHHLLQCSVTVSLYFSQ